MQDWTDKYNSGYAVTLMYYDKDINRQILIGNQVDNESGSSDMKFFYFDGKNISEVRSKREIVINTLSEVRTTKYAEIKKEKKEKYVFEICLNSRYMKQK